MDVTTVLNNHPDRVRLIYLLAFIAAILYASIHVFRIASLPTDENIFADTKEGLQIIDISKGGASDLAGLKVGDIITLINGQTFRDAFQADSILRNGAIGKELDYTILRDGKEHHLKVRLAEAGLPIVYILLILSGILTFALGCTVVMMRPAYSAARLFGMTFLLIGMHLPIVEPVRGSVYTDFIQTAWPYVRYGSIFLGLPLIGHLILHFPVRRDPGRYPRWLFGIMYGVPILLLVLLLTSSLPRGEWLGPIINLILLVSIFVVPPFYFRKNPNPEYRAKSVYILAAGIIMLFTLVMRILYGFVRYDLQILIYLPSLYLVLPILFGYTIVKFRIFDIYLVIRRSLIYSLLTVVVVLLFIVSLVIVINALPTMNLDIPALHFTERSVELVNLKQLPDPERTKMEKSMLIGFGVVATVLLWQVQKYGRRMLERKFYRQKYDYRQAMREFSTLASRFADRDALAREVVKKVSDIMHLKGAALAFVSNGSFHIRESTGLQQDCCRTISLDTREQWVQNLYLMRTSQAVDNLGITRIFDGTGIQFLTPVVAHERLEGIIMLGEKHSETNYTKDDIELLDSISHHVSAALETMRLYGEVSEKERMRRELEIARRIQLDSLPKETPDIPGLDIAAVSKPAMEVGGDFYDFLVRHDEVTFILGDVSGKGTSAALYMSRVQGIIRSLDSYQPSLWELFVRLNSQVYGHIERKSYVTLIGVRVNLLNYHTTFIRAGHLPLVHYHSDAHSIEVYQPQGLGVGLDERQFSQSLTEQKIQPRKGDVILLFSDGLTEAQNPRQEEYGLEALRKVLLQHAHENTRSIQHAVMESVLRHVNGANQHDDISCLVIKLV